MPENGTDVSSSVRRELYEKLSAPFDKVHHDVRGGVEFDFITGEQCVSRLNTDLGLGYWSFQIKEHGINTEADEVWVLGKFDAMVGALHVVFEQFGSQKIKRSRATGMPLDIGFDLKGASTDCLKKCATYIGVGLYLHERVSPEEKAAVKRAEREAGKAGSQSPSTQAARQSPGSQQAVPSSTPSRTSAPTATQEQSISNSPRATPGAKSTNGGTSSGATTAASTTQASRAGHNEELPEQDDFDPDVAAAAALAQAEEDAGIPKEEPTSPSSSNGTTTTGTPPRKPACQYCGEVLQDTYTVRTSTGEKRITQEQAIARSKTVFQGVIVDPACGEKLYDKDVDVVAWFTDTMGRKVTWK